MKCFTFLFELLSFLLFVLYPFRRIIATLIESEKGNNVLCTLGAPKKFSLDFLLRGQHSVDCNSLPVLSTFDDNIYFAINLVSFHFEL